MGHFAPNPYDAPPLRGLGPVKGTLRVFVALQCWGYAAAHLQFGAHSAMARMLEREFFLPVQDTRLLDLVAAIALSIAGITCLLRPAWPILLFLFLGQIVFVGSKAWLAEEGHPVLILMQHAAMLFSPIVLACADMWPSRNKFSLGFWIAISSLMRFAICASLIGLGLQGILDSHQQGELARVAEGTIRTLMGFAPDDATSGTALAVFGGIQIGLGLTLLLARSRPAASLATLVGVIAAASFSLGLGLAGYPRTLTHMILPGLAAALGLFWVNAIQEGEMSYVPETSMRPARAH